jgi:DNA-binding transcriptional ArsR family regulator
MAEHIPESVLAVVAEKFRLLGDQTRLALIRTLMKDGEQNVGQLVSATGRTEANVSKHLKQVARAGMLARRKEGLQVFYSLSDPVIEKICRLVCDSVVEDVKGQLENPPAS